jgi:hypothetical protein
MPQEVAGGLETMDIPFHNMLKGHSPREDDNQPVKIGQHPATNEVLRNANSPYCPEPPTSQCTRRAQRPKEMHQDEESIGPEEMHHDEDCCERIPFKAQWHECFPHPAGVPICQKATMIELLCNKCSGR